MDKILRKSETLNSDTTRTKLFSKVSLAYKRIGDSTKFKKVNADLRNIASEIGDYQSLGEAYWDLGNYYKYAQPDSAYFYYKEAYDNFFKADLSEGAKEYPGRMLYAMAKVKDRNRDYVGAEKHAVDAINFYKEKNINSRLFSTYTFLATTQNGLNNFEKAIQYHKLARDYIKYRPKESQSLDSIYNNVNIANTYSRNDHYSKSSKVYEEILADDSLQTKDSRTYGKVLASLAYNKLKSGDTDYDNMANLIDKSTKVLDSLGDTYHQARNQEFLAELMIARHDTAKAVQAASEAKEIAQQTNNNDRLLSSVQLLTKIDRPNSAQHAQYYFALSDSLQTQERNIRDKFARIEMETDEVIQENEALARQKKIWAGIAFGLMLMAIATYIIITQRAHNQRLRFEQSQQEANQEIYGLMLNQQGKLQEGKQLEQKRISEELHDGILGQMLGIRLILSGLNERDDEAAIAQRAELIEKLQELEEEIRTISHELNDASYQKIHNFILAIEDLVKTIGESSGIQNSFSYEKNEDWDALQGELKINMYRIVQECLQNCVKHAQCENVTVNLGTESKLLELTIADDGKGFDVKKAKKGIGLKNITSRVDKLSGTLLIESSKGNGTTVRIKIPKEQKRNNSIEERKNASRKLQEA
ncbi:sensor histidine kinase [Allomuricauda sp. d1]|uniref:ATP-binding protein n=1 Tax=Allomuricauda sp. d1 TaxID=3136725 RepID=UPI0031D8F09E